MYSADSSCPVCRFNLQQEEVSECLECQSTEGLWMCLLCGQYGCFRKILASHYLRFGFEILSGFIPSGYIGCGRYQHGHSLAHFQQCGHTFAVELRTRRVWDYVRDGFVHRLIASDDGSKPIGMQISSVIVQFRITHCFWYGLRNLCRKSSSQGAHALVSFEGIA